MFDHLFSLVVFVCFSQRLYTATFAIVRTPWRITTNACLIVPKAKQWTAKRKVNAFMLAHVAHIRSRWLYKKKAPSNAIAKLHRNYVLCCVCALHCTVYMFLFLFLLLSNNHNYRILSCPFRYIIIIIVSVDQHAHRHYFKHGRLFCRKLKLIRLQQMTSLKHYPDR